MRTLRLTLWLSLLMLPALFQGASAWAAGPSLAIDLATIPASQGKLVRVHGHTGDGSQGVPVAGSLDCDGDTFPDYALASMKASPLGRSLAGEVYLVFGDGTVSGTYDTAVMQADILEIIGDGTNETAGSEVWMDDVTGDGLGDLLIARQNYSPPGRNGAGALTILVGGSELRTHAGTLSVLDLRSPPAGISMTTLVGDDAYHRLGIWMRTGDVTGDGIADIVVGADQTSSPGEAHHGAVWVIRGGSHLVTNQVEIDLADFGTMAFDSTPLAGHVARILPPSGSPHYHFGATCQIADLDGNGRAEVLIAAALNRSGATIPAPGGGVAHGSGGSPDGTLYIAWENNFPVGTWVPGFSFDISASPGNRSIIDGGVLNRDFGEEILGGLDYDSDGAADLFVGDIVGDGSPAQNRPNAGMGHVLYNASLLKGLSFNLDNLPVNIDMTTFLGGGAGDIATDTAMHGDFDGDGADDLAFSSPHADPLGRSNAGTIHIFHGQQGLWPTLIDLRPGALPPQTDVWVTEIYGANGTSGADSGDVLCYSAAAGDVDGDGKIDIITNEMQGNGVGPGTDDVGNLIVLGGALYAAKTMPALSLKGLGLFLLLATAGILAVRRRLYKRDASTPVRNRF